MNNKTCEDYLADLTDACTRGAGRAVDDEICDAFIPMDVYEVNKNESWELGYKQGRADALSECLNIVRANGYQVSLIMIKGLLEQLKEQKNE